MGHTNNAIKNRPDSHLEINEPLLSLCVYTSYLETSDEPGSLKAMCPSGPIP